MNQNVSAPRVVNVSDLRDLAKKRLPKMVFGYIDSGADREQTLAQNCSAYNEILFRPRCAVATPEVELNISVLKDNSSHALAHRSRIVSVGEVEEGNRTLALDWRNNS